MFSIDLYREEGTWLFDDESRNIKAEPFVMGASEVIQRYLDRKGLGSLDKGVEIEFSLEPIDNPDIVLNCTKKCFPLKLAETKAKFGKHTATHLNNISSLFKYEEDTSAEPTSAYYVDQEGDECWLCPAQLKFFDVVADTIYARFK